MQRKIKIKDAFVFLNKSKIKAGYGLEVGKYPFYTSSSVLGKYLNSYEIEGESLIFGTGGSASIHHSYGEFSTSTDCYVAQSNNKYEIIEQDGLIYTIKEKESNNESNERY